MNLDELIEKAKLAGGRTTRTRMAILSYMFSLDKPASSKEILNFLKTKKILVNRTTIYRELSFLINNCIAREVRLIGKPSLFELAYRHCHHLICLKCNKVKTIAMDNHLRSEEIKIMKKEDFKITNHSLEFYGLCQKCR